jgi:response regulator RpfG family c-di-GMP phosphodiesterase
MNYERKSYPGKEIADRLRRVCEAHDPSIDPHLRRVGRYSCEIGELMGLSERELIHLHYAAPLHDVGKIAIPLALLNHAGRLSPEQTATVRDHAAIGHRILEGSRFAMIRCAANIALSHHESWNGSGYPHGLAGEAIPIEARIVAVADVFDALLSPRPYKPAWDADQVIMEMRQLREVKFDPGILDLFLSHLRNSAELASVCAQSAHTH